MILKERKLFQFHFDFFKASNPNLTKDIFIEHVKSPIFKRELEILSKKLIKDIFPNHGAICLTTCASNIPMWGHYANNHRGYCLIFEVDFKKISEMSGLSSVYIENYINDISNEKKLILFSSKLHEFVFAKVRYDDKPPTINLNDLYLIQDNPYERDKHIIKNTVAVKFKQWKYENEFRLISNQNSKDGGLLDLRGYAPFLKITGVIMGHKLNDNEKEIFNDK